ncbi:Cell division protein FtsA [Bacteroidales bacterium Barb4]|nr:Cell division protein FtsA [Bacteroidales bacterium Barb4]
MAAYADFIVAIDLGTSRLTGMAGRKNASGALTVVACETEDAAIGIRRGCVFNIEETATKIKSLVRRLELKAGGTGIAKVYVGIGGQSVCSIDHSVAKDLGEEQEVTEETLDMLHEECRAYQPELSDVLDIVPPSYRVDGKLVTNPVGVPCKRIEACFKLIVGRPSLRKHIINSISDRAQIKIAGIIISPLALADVVLTDNEKELGCILVDFGAGVTSLSVYKGGTLQYLCVIPLGGRLITKDLTTLNIIEAEAERVKITYGNAVADREDETTVQVNAAESASPCDIRLSEINNIVEARAKEILENVFARLESTEVAKSLGAGVVITGGASNLRNIAELMQKRLKKEVRYAFLRKGLLDNDSIHYNTPENIVALSLLLLPDAENCAVRPAPPVVPSPTTVSPAADPAKEPGTAQAPPVSATQASPASKDPQETQASQPKASPKEEKPQDKPKGKNGRIKKTFMNIMGNLFADETA